MKVMPYGLVLIIPLIVAGCVEKFTPEIHEPRYRIVVNGLITNQPEVYTVRLYWTIPFGGKTSFPMAGCSVTVHDDLGHIYQFSESSTPGIYLSDKTTFQGVVGRKYTLRINTLNATPAHYSYESVPVEMKAVPPIDSLFYKKVIISEAALTMNSQEGCQIYLNTYDPDGDCRFYRWDYTETWKFQVQYSIIANQVCWISNSSKNINIKNTSSLSEDRISRHPLIFISNKTDRLSKRYSVIVNQYSLSENEFAYWEKFKNAIQDVGSLYDKIPSSITGNMFCVEDPDEQVLGYFSVSAKTSKRIYIDETFRGLVNIYEKCADATLDIKAPIPGLNEWAWIIYTSPEDAEHPYKVITWNKGCVDCTVRGTTTRPEFWEDFK
jgi:hypothetical protein